MQLLKEEFARKRIHNGSSVQIENAVTQVTVRHHSASLVKLNSYPGDGIFNQHLTTIKDSYKTLCTAKTNVFLVILIPSKMFNVLVTKAFLDEFCSVKLPPFPVMISY